MIEGVFPARIIKQTNQDLEADIGLGTPTFLLVDRYANFADPWSNGRVFGESLEALRRFGLPPFDRLSRNPSFYKIQLPVRLSARDTQPLSGEEILSGTPTSLTFDLEEARFVYGIRLRYSYGPAFDIPPEEDPYLAGLDRLRFVGAFGVPAHHFRMFWRDRGRNEFAEGERFLGMSLADENSEPFNHDIPGMPEGQRTIVAWVDDTINQIRIDPDDKPCMFKLLEIELVVPGPDPESCVGHLDIVDTEVIRGWAWNQEQPDQPIQVKISDGETPLATVTADQFRQELLTSGVGDGKHGFRLSVPATLRDGKPHTIRARVDGAVNDLSPSLTLAPTERSAVPADAVVGFLDEVNEQVLCGWAWDSGSPETTLSLEIYSDETKLLTVRANEFREDLHSEGIGRHAFAVPTPKLLTDGNIHTVLLKLAGTEQTLARRVFSKSP